MTHRRTRAALVMAGAAVALTPASAQAAAVVAPECARLIPGEKTMPIQGTGFTPNSYVSLRTPDGSFAAGAQTDAAGNFADAFFAPTLPVSVERRSLELTATDSAGVAAAPVPLDVVRVTATLPDRARPTSRVRYRVYGFPSGKTVYLHIRRGGKTRGSFKVSRANGDCGIASRRMRYMPLRRFSTGRYDYYFQQSKRFDRSQPGVRLSISVFRRVRSG